jgi:hypothetical protein
MRKSGGGLHAERFNRHNGKIAVNEMRHAALGAPYRILKLMKKRKSPMFSASKADSSSVKRRSHAASEANTI